MRPLSFVLAALFWALPALSLEPNQGDVQAEYDLYRAEICGAACPPGLTDKQAQILILKQYCENRGPGVSCAKIQSWTTPPLLTYDHRQRDWNADSSIAKRTQEDVNGIPTVDARRGQTIVPVVTATNPLLYTVTPSEIKLQPIEQFSDLQKLAGLIGGNVAAILQVQASEKAVLGMSGGPLKVAADALANAGKDYIAGQNLADCVILGVQEATSFVQAVELSRTDDYPSALRKCQGNDLTAASVRNLTSTLARAKEALARRCVDVPAAVVALLAVEPPQTATVREAVTKYDAATLAPDCMAWNANPNVVEELETKVVGRIRAELKKPSPDLPTLYNDLRTNFGDTVQRLAATTKGVKAVEDPLAKLFAALPTIGKAAENLEMFRERLLQNVTAKPVPCSRDAATRCVPQAAVATFLVVPGGPSHVTRWESVHTRTIKIAADSPYTADVVARRSAVETTYNLRSTLATIFDIGVSVTKTDLQSPTFGAVRIDDGDGNFSNDRFAVGVIDQESQSGKLALMLNIVPLRLWDLPKLVQSLGVQVGASTDTGKPALFWGLSYGLGKYVRVGWGETSQRVTTLREEETPLGHLIANAGEIRKRQKYERDEYWSLMISIRALRLFSN